MQLQSWDWITRGAISHSTPLLQVPQPAVTVGHWHVKTQQLLLSETLISGKLREMQSKTSQVIAAGITLYLSLPEMSTQTG